MKLEGIEKPLTPWEEISSVVSAFKQPIGEDLNGQHQKNITTLKEMIGDHNEFFAEDQSTFALPETESEEDNEDLPETTNLFIASCEQFFANYVQCF